MSPIRLAHSSQQRKFLRRYRVNRYYGCFGGRTSFTKESFGDPYDRQPRSLLVKGRQSPSMQSLTFSPERSFTRLYARITQEDGAFTVTVRLLNHRKKREGAWGEEIATSIDMASAMIDSIAKQFRISQKCISVRIVMDKFRDGTFH
jgi:hypothetical protein